MAGIRGYSLGSCRYNAVLLPSNLPGIKRTGNIKHIYTHIYITNLQHNHKDRRRIFPEEEGRTDGAPEPREAALPSSPASTPPRLCERTGAEAEGRTREPGRAAPSRAQTLPCAPSSCSADFPVHDRLSIGLIMLSSKRGHAGDRAAGRVLGWSRGESREMVSRKTQKELYNEKCLHAPAAQLPCHAMTHSKLGRGHLNQPA